ncbi:hypothetical protein [Nocardia sp. BMG51109]|uniref:hypothetical protein n=1 Tax=Nocardia sp. BMG51109 TaxID=1056816 RepID=UPI0004B769C7|nr:hypothetical protein [Nocardia sp. BMG51109]
MELLPGMRRLLAVWDGAEESATTLEHASQVFVTMWTIRFDGLDLLNVSNQHSGVLGGQAAGLGQCIARAIDDEVTWQLGNRAESVTLIDDDLPETVTVGELLGRIAMVAVLMDKVPGRPEDNPFGPVLADFGRRYESLAVDLVAGRRRQPRRRSHGAPPIPPPQRIDLAYLPRNQQRVIGEGRQRARPPKHGDRDR